jgi:zeaxanthin glucosyltransferase
MTHFGILCPPSIGHLNPMCTLGRELQRRAHRVTFFNVPDVQGFVAKAELDFYSIGEAEFPLGTIEQNYKQLGEMSGLAALKYTVRWLTKDVSMLFKEVPTALKATGVEVLIVDQVTSGGGTIADYLKLPFVTVCNALLVNLEAGIPPYFTPWQYRNSPWARWRNQAGNFFLNRISQPIRDRVSEQRSQWQLPPYASQIDRYSTIAQICQLPAEFDFPRVELPPCFHYTGPLQEPSGLEAVSFPEISFPFDQLTEQPLIYASLGTLQNRKWEIFRAIAEACLGLDAQLVISLGNPNNQQPDLNLPGSPLVVSYAPHQQLIEKASLVITHAGMNTTLGALSSGVPLVAIPITNEQPGIAARIAWTGTGEIIPPGKFNKNTLTKAIEQVLKQSSYKQNALRLQKAIQQAGGVKQAADIIEKFET